MLVTLRRILLTWDKLSAKNQAAIESVSGEAYARMAGKAWDSADGPAMTMAKGKGVTVSTASDKMRLEIRRKTFDLRAAWMSAAKTKGVDGQAAVKYMAAQIKALKSN